MAELNDPQEPTFPSKRKPDHPIPLDTPVKAPKLATLDSKNHTDDCSQSGKDVVQHQAGNDNELQNDVVHDKVEKDESDDDEEEEEEEEEEEGDDDEEESNGEAEVDRKGKGILRDDKGKGKLIEDDDDDGDDDDSDDDDDDDSDEDGNASGADSDFSDDPLAEVDLNNILPSRTRRRTVHPGLHIAGDAANVDAADDDDDDDDSDA